MERDDDREALLPGQPAENLHDPHLVADVQVARRFVEEDRPGLLDERPGDHHPLALPAGEFADVTEREIPEVEGVERGNHLLLVGSVHRPVQVGPPPHQDGLEDRRPCPVPGRLRHVGHRLRDLPPMHRAKLPPIERHRSPAGGEHPVDAPDQRRLPAPVRPHEPENLARADREGDPVKHPAVAVGKREAVYRDPGHQASLRCMKR